MSGLTVRDAAKAVDAYHDSITDALTRGEAVTIPGFGKFSTKHRAARTGVNPQNPSQKVHIPAAQVPKFSAGSALKAAVKGG
jgi:DNA-binding protein HU-beta